MSEVIVFRIGYFRLKMGSINFKLYKDTKSYIHITVFCLHLHKYCPQTESWWESCGGTCGLEHSTTFFFSCTAQTVIVITSLPHSCFGMCSSGRRLIKLPHYLSVCELYALFTYEILLKHFWQQKTDFWFP